MSSQSFSLPSFPVAFCAGQVGRRLPTAGYHPDKEVACVIVTINTGSSYDDLFRSVHQEGPTAESCISLFQLSYRELGTIQQLLDDDNITNDAPKILKEIVRDIYRVEPNSVLFNFECCSGCGDKSFPVRKIPAFTRAMLDHGYTVQFGDFSVKSLLHEWDEAILGPNPFFRVGQCNHTFTLRFDSKVLAESPSAQLQLVGELCSKGEARVGAMGDTVGFSVNWKKAKTNAYTLKVLSIITEKDGKPVRNRECTVGKYKGEAGHIMLEYPVVEKIQTTAPPKTEEGHTKMGVGPARGGILMLSAGHWVELARLNTSTEELLRCAEMEYGADVSAQIRSDLLCSPTVAEQDRKVQSYAQGMVKSRAPVSYSDSVVSKKKDGTSPTKAGSWFGRKSLP